MATVFYSRFGSPDLSGKPHPVDDRVMAALKAANIPFVFTSPVGLKGESLTGGTVYVLGHRPSATGFLAKTVRKAGLPKGVEVKCMALG